MALGWPGSQRRELSRGRKEKKTVATYLIPTIKWAVKLLKGHFRKTGQESKESNKISWSMKIVRFFWSNTKGES